MTHGLPGKFIVIDGLDGVGKGVVQGAIIDYLKGQGKRVLDLHEFWKANHQHPDFSNKEINGKLNPHYVDLSTFDVLVSAEPTFVGIGRALREEIITRTGRTYGAHFTALNYSNDRLVLYKRVLLPALASGKHVIQSRSVSTSLVYQPLQSVQQGDTPVTVTDIMALEGNAFALQHAPTALIVPTIRNAEEVMKRLAGREKDDNCKFENLDFQLKIKPHYEGEILKKIFEERGTRVCYLDAGKSVEDTKLQAVEIAKEMGL